MSDENKEATPVTLEQVQELINTTVNGLAARQQKEFGKLLTPITEQLTGFGSTIESLKTTSTPNKKEDQNTDPRWASMEKELSTLKTKNEASEQKAAKMERENALGKALGGFQFANDVSRDTAFRTFASDLQQGSDGAYYIGDEPLDTAVKGRMTQLTGLLAPKAVGGSGASSGQGQSTAPMEIKPGMTKAELQAVANEALKQL